MFSQLGGKSCRIGPGKRRKSTPGTVHASHVSGTSERGYQRNPLLACTRLRREYHDQNMHMYGEADGAGSQRLLDAHRSSCPAIASSSDTITCSHRRLQSVASNHVVNFYGNCRVVGDRPSNLISHSAQTQIGDRACGGRTEARHAATPHRSFVFLGRDSYNIPLSSPGSRGYSSCPQESPPFSKGSFGPPKRHVDNHPSLPHTNKLAHTIRPPCPLFGSGRRTATPSAP